MAAVLINGDHVKALKAKLQLFNSATIGAGNTDPTSVALLGAAGDVYISTSTFKMYQKQDSGTTTNWTRISDQLILGAFDSSPNANAATISGDTLTLQPASASFPGGVSTGTQSFSGNKTFTGMVTSLTFSSSSSNSATSGVLNFSSLDIALAWRNQANSADIVLAKNSSDSLTWNGNAFISSSGALSATNLSGNNTGDVTLAAFDSSPNANGASLSGQILTLQPADATHPGGVSTASQTFSGSKTFSSLTNLDGGIDRSTAGTLTIGATNATTINIGNSGATINIQGTTIYENTPLLQVADPLITVNHGGAAGSGQNSGIQIEENAIITGYAETSSDRNSWIFKAPNTAGIATITPGAGGITLAGSILNGTTSGNNTGDQTITLTGGVTGSGTGSFATTVVTNANLTGPITSVGNATSIASQTGTGSTFVMSASPTITGTLTSSGTTQLNGATNVAAGQTINIAGSSSGTATISASTNGGFLVTSGGINATGVINAFGGIANLTTISMSGQLTSTLATGTAPFVVASTTQVANLNAATAGSFTGSLSGDVTGTQGATVLSATSNSTLTTLSGLTTATNLVSVGSITTGAWNATAIAVSRGGTGATTANAGFNALSPMTTAGDIIYENSTPVAARLPIGSTGNVLTVSGGLPVWAAPATSGTVTSVSVVSANGFAGTVATATSTPAITISTSITGILQGNGTAISAATTTGSGSVVLATSPTLVTPSLGTPSILVGTNITGTASGFTAGTVTTNANLTGPITSVGNATLVTSQTGTGSTFVMNTSPTISGATFIGITSFPSGASINTSGEIVAAGFYSSSSNRSTTGVYRMSSGDSGIGWRNFAGTGDVVLAKNTSDSLTWNGNAFITSTGQLISTVATGTPPLVVSSTTQVANLNAALAGNVTATSNSTLTTLTALTTASNLSSVGTITSGTWNGTTIAIANGGTGQTTALAAFNALSPMTTAGDITYESVALSATRLPIGATGNVLTVSGGLPVWAAPATSGTVTSVSVVSANGLAGTVATSTTTPAITLSTTVTGILQGNGTAISAATTTGTGSVVLATSPTLVTPNLGTPSTLVGTNITGTAAGLTAGTVTTNANLTGDITSVGNATTAAATQANIATLSRAAGVAVHGTNTNDNAAAGFVGEFISSGLVGSNNFPGASGAWGDATSISLTAGDWDVSMTIQTTSSGATVSDVEIGISVTSGNSSTGLDFGDNALDLFPPTAATNSGASLGPKRFSLSGTTTIYAKLLGSYSVATPKYTCRLSARRMR